MRTLLPAKQRNQPGPPDDIVSLRARITELEAEVALLRARPPDGPARPVQRPEVPGSLLQFKAELDALLRSLGIGAVFVDPALRIHRLTPPLPPGLGLTAKDIGSAFPEWAERAGHTALTSSVQSCLRSGRGAELEQRDADGRWVLIRVRPYRTATEEIGGVVLNFVDVSPLKQAEETLRRSRERLRFNLANTPAVIYARSGEAPFAVTEIGGNVVRQLGYSADAILQNPELLPSLIHPEDRERVERTLAELVVGHVQTLEYRVRNQRGDWVWLRDEMRRVARRGGAKAILGLWSDISEYRRAAGALEASEQRWRRLVETAPDGIVIHQEGVILLVNRKALDLFGAVAPGQLIGRKFLDLIRSDSRAAVEESLRRTIEEGGIAEAAQGTVLRLDGFSVEVEMSSAAIVEKGRTALQTVLRDITERRRAEEEIRHLVFHDALTGLPNRTLLLDRVGQAVAQAGRHNGRCAVMMLDLDQFKDINDTLGHPAGDRLLRSVAERLLDTLRRADTLARFGGDEYAIVQTDVGTPEAASTLAQKVLDALSRPFLIDDQEVHTTASIGITIVPDDASEPDQAIRNADLALYRAKAQGGNRWQFYVADMNAEVQRRKSMERDLRRGLEHDQLGIVLQPQFRLTDRRMVGAEALVRWTSPDRGQVSPRDFIPVAEQSGLIRPLGRMVLDRACRVIGRWQRIGQGRSIAVNLSAAQLKHGDLLQVVRRAIADHGIDPSLLELEITESLLFEPSNEAVAETLRKIAAFGVRLSIDDFGTGYSSLAYLKRFPVEKIKIDQSFIRDIGRDADNEAIVAAMITLAHSLGKTVLAEGVETDEQLEFLIRAGCDEAQGYAFARPMPVESLEPMLEAD